MIVIEEPKEEIVSFVDLTRGGQRTKTARCIKARYDYRARKKKLSATIDANYWKGLLSNQERPAVLEKW